MRLRLEILGSATSDRACLSECLALTDMAMRSLHAPPLTTRRHGCFDSAAQRRWERRSATGVPPTCHGAAPTSLHRFTVTAPVVFVAAQAWPFAAAAQPTFRAIDSTVTYDPDGEIAQLITSVSVATAALLAVWLARRLPTYYRSEGQAAGVLAAGVTCAFNLGYMAHGFMLDTGFNYLLASGAWLAPLWVGWNRWRRSHGQLPSPPAMRVVRNEGLRTE